MPVRASIDQVIACPQLPSLPAVAMEVLSLTKNPQVRLQEIARVVQHDQALSAKILKTVNSSYYGLPKPCPSIARALTLLGLSAVKSLVLGFSLVDSTRSATEGLDLIDYWRRSVYSAAAARRIAVVSRCCDPEEAFIAALMQDLGMPAIQSTIGRAYAEIIAKAAGDHDLLPEAETRGLGFTHGEAGARLGERWHLPASIIDAIRRHHSPESPSEHQRIVHAVALGYDAARTLSAVESRAALARFRARAGDWFDLGATQATQLLSTITEDAKELARLFQLNTGALPDINAILEQAEQATMQHQVSVQQEAERLRQTNSDLARMALTDDLTAVGNRKRFDEELRARFTDASTGRCCLGMLMIDADRFKSINDTYGHAAGDAVLVELAQRLQTGIGAMGTVCRYGGEEFTVILPGLGRRDIARVAEELRMAVAGSPFSLSHLEGSVPSVSITISVGAAVYEPGAAQCLSTPQMLVQAADKAVYAAKHAGRNCIRVFSFKEPAKAA